MMLLTITDLTLPIANPVLKFLIILSIILFAPLLLNKLRIPHILGLIIAGAIVGPNGFNLILRDSSIILSGTAGLLYIMFLAGLEIDLTEFKKNSSKSLVFGLFTFLIPMTLGTLSGLYILNYGWMTSILLASMFASHTLIAYPIVNKLGVIRNRAVTVTVGGTMITDTLALLVLAVIVGMTQGVVDTYFWIKLSVSILIFGVVVLFLFPIIARFFFKTFSDSVSQYIFVLFMVFLGAVFAELAGIEAIIGAFLSGLALNRLIPHSSPLMNRVEFIGNAIFIPFFLIGVGMLIDYRVFISDTKTLFVALVMTVVATVSKYLAAYAAQKTFGYTKNERSLIFGLSNAQAAATLAAVLVGYNVILGTTPDGTPIRLLDESVLNGTIVMIFITCTIASISAQRGAHKLSMQEGLDEKKKEKEGQNILIPLSNPLHTEELFSFGNAICAKDGLGSISVTNIIDNQENDSRQLQNAKKIFERSTQIASASEKQVNTILRYDTSFSNGILSLMREYDITDLVLGVDTKQYLMHATLGNIITKVIKESNVNTFVYRAKQPLSTVKRQILIIPPKAEQELGFTFWMNRVWRMAKRSGVKLVIYAHPETYIVIRKMNEDMPVDISYVPLHSYRDILIISKDIRIDDGLIFVLSKRNNPSYDENMDHILSYIDSYFQEMNFILIYPIQQNGKTGEIRDLINPSGTVALSRIEDLTDTLMKKVKKTE